MLCQRFVASGKPACALQALALRLQAGTGLAVTELYLHLTVANIHAPERRQEVPFLVDTGATLAWIPQEVAQALGIQTVGTFPLELADASITERPYGFCLFIYDGETVAGNVIIGPPECEPLVGTHILQDFRLNVSFDRHGVRRGGALRAKPASLRGKGSIRSRR